MHGTNNYKKFKQNIQSLERLVDSFALFHKFAKNKRAVSAVVSNLILIGAVMAVGLAALAYARSTSISYQENYAQDMSSDISKLKEVLTFEYVHYDSSSHQLSVYFLNSGAIDTTISRLSVNGSVVNFTTHQLNGQVVSNNVIPRGQEAYLVSSGTILASGVYSLKITSGSESIFAYNFVV